LNGSPAICRIEKGLHKNVLAFIFFALHRAAPGSTTPAFPCLRRPGNLPPATPAPALPILRRLRLSRACHQARAPALISAQFYFFDPLYFFRPAQGEVKKRPHTYPTFALSNPQS
jgi:hypothetical protein